MSILITGVAGFIGFSLCNRLLEYDDQIIGIDNLNSYYDVKLKDARISKLKEKAKKLNKKFLFIKENIENKEEIEKLFNKYKPKYVVHLAAQAGVRYSIKNPHAYIQSNIVGFLNILEGCRNNPVKNLIYASSSSVYGGNIKMPFCESNGVDHPLSLYGATKKSNELMAHSYSSIFDIPSTGLRFFTVYGPWGRPDMALFLFTKSIIEKKPIKVFNEGKMLRDFTYIDDIVQSICLLIKKPAKKNINFDKLKLDPSKSWAPFKVFNIGNSNPVPLLEYVYALEETLGVKAQIEYLPMQPGDVESTYAKTDYLENYIGFKPMTKIKEGIKKFVDWYKDFYQIS
ncbi:GDP-mannose 4,6-dehydratase [Prochlorococcus sp. AH-716-E13]|nr:GDP-mannose 4,6-dehydratase [Prochlorococcus sp. AH-716-E13]